MTRKEGSQLLKEVPILGTEWQWHLNPINKVVGFSRQSVWDKSKKYKVGITGVCDVGSDYFYVCFGSGLQAKEEIKWVLTEKFQAFVQLVIKEVAKPNIDIAGVLEKVNPFPCDEKKRKQQQRQQQRQQQIAAALSKRST